MVSNRHLLQCGLIIKWQIITCHLPVPQQESAHSHLGALDVSRWEIALPRNAVAGAALLSRGPGVGGDSLAPAVPTNASLWDFTWTVL